MKKFLALISSVSIGLLSFDLAEARTSPIRTEGGIRIETLYRGNLAWTGQPIVYPSGVPEITVQKLTIPANTTLPWHKHPMPIAGYVLSGTLRVEKKIDRKKKTFTQGQACLEVINEWHRGKTGNKPVILILFYAGARGMPLSQPFVN